VVNVPGRLLMKAFAESQTTVAVTLVAGASPVLQTRAPTGKLFGPTLTLLLSKPMIFQVMGVIVKFAACKCRRLGLKYNSRQQNKQQTKAKKISKAFFHKSLT
jgi:hypothetical protein